MTNGNEVITFGKISNSNVSQSLKSHYFFKENSKVKKIFTDSAMKTKVALVSILFLAVVVVECNEIKVSLDEIDEPMMESHLADKELNIMNCKNNINKEDALEKSMDELN
ncbi:hypothetical protein TrispH2_010977, partial [Trichoplax sp. H2]